MKKLCATLLLVLPGLFLPGLALTAQEAAAAGTAASQPAEPAGTPEAAAAEALPAVETQATPAGTAEPVRDAVSGAVQPGTEPAAGASRRITLAIINLYAKALDFQFGEPGIVSVGNLPPNQPSKFFTLDLQPETWMFFRETDSQDWKVYADRSGTVLPLDFAAGERLVLCVTPAGDLVFTPVESPAAGQGGALVSLLNVSGRSLEAMQVSKMHLNSQLYQSPEIASARMTRFASIDSGLYTIAAILDGQRVLMMSPDNQAMSLVELLPASWNIAVALAAPEGPAPLRFNVWNISE